MKLHHLRNATLLLTIGEHRILVDPMLSEPEALPGFRLVGGPRRRNPLVPLPAEAMDAIGQATSVLITHEHPDHLDPPAVEWIKSRELPVWASSLDASNLRSKGLRANSLPDEAFGYPVEVVPGTHGHGIAGWFMGPVSGFYLAAPGEPSVYLTGDTVKTERVVDAIRRLKPDVVVAPAGAANFGIGKDLLFSVDELVEVAKRCSATLVFNHLEAIDHCPTSRENLRKRMESEGLSERVFIPNDGEQREFVAKDGARAVAPGRTAERKPGFQKWLTAKFAGT